MGDFFGKGKLINYVKALLAYISGMAVFSIIAFLIGSIIDFLAWQATPANNWGIAKIIVIIMFLIASRFDMIMSLENLLHSIKFEIY